MLHMIKEIVKQFPPIRRVLDQRNSLLIECGHLLDQVHILTSHSAKLENSLLIERGHLLDQVHILTSHSVKLENSLDELKEQVSQLQRFIQDEKIRLDLSEISIDTAVSVENLSSYKEEGQLRFQGTYSPITGKEIERILVYGNGVLLGADKPSDIHSENGRSIK